MWQAVIRWVESAGTGRCTAQVCSTCLYERGRQLLPHHLWLLLLLLPLLPFRAGCSIGPLWGLSGGVLRLLPWGGGTGAGGIGHGCCLCRSGCGCCCCQRARCSRHSSEARGGRLLFPRDLH